MSGKLVIWQPGDVVFVDRTWTADEAAKHPRDEEGKFAKKPKAADDYSHLPTHEPSPLYGSDWFGDEPKGKDLARLKAGARFIRQYGSAFDGNREFDHGEIVTVTAEDELRMYSQKLQEWKIAVEADDPTLMLLKDVGFAYTRDILDGSYDVVNIAIADGRVAGAHGYDILGATSPTEFGRGYIGSTHIRIGAGTALVRQYLRQAKEHMAGVHIFAASRAARFWQKVGFSVPDEGGDSWLEPAEVWKLVELIDGAETRDISRYVVPEYGPDDFNPDSDEFAYLLKHIPQAGRIEGRAWTAEEAAKHPRKEDGTFAEKPDKEMTLAEVDDRLDPPEISEYKVRLVDGYLVAYETGGLPISRAKAEPGARLEQWDEWRQEWQFAYQDLYDLEAGMRELFPNLEKFTVEEPEVRDLLKAMNAGNLDSLFSLDFAGSYIRSESAAELLAGLQVAKFYPDTAAQITEIRFAELSDEIKGNYGGMQAGIHDPVLNDWRPPEPGLIQFNLLRFGAEPESLYSDEFGDVKAIDFHPPGSKDSWAAIGRHEFGHAVFYTTVEGHAKIIDYINGRYGRPLNKKGLPWVRSREVDVRTPESYFPSTYGMRNQHELFAELFDFLAPGGYYSDPANGQTPAERLLEERLMKDLSSSETGVPIRSVRAWTAEEAAKHPRNEDGTFASKPDEPHGTTMTIVESDEELEFVEEDVLMNPDAYLKDDQFDVLDPDTGIRYHVWRSGPGKTAWREAWPFNQLSHHPIEEWDSATHMWRVSNPALWTAVDDLQELFPNTDIVVQEWDSTSQSVIRTGDVEVAAVMRGFKEVVGDWSVLTDSKTGIDRIVFGSVSQPNRYGEALNRSWRKDSEQVLTINIKKLNADGSAELASDAADGWHPYNAVDWESVSIHELGHFVHYGHRDTVDAWIAREYGKPALVDQNGRVLWGLPNSDAESSRRYVPVPPMKFPSRYAMKDAWELWAESFTRAYGSRHALDPKTGYTPDIWPLLEAMKSTNMVDSIDLAQGILPATPT
jgi:hypothetical protein